MQSVLLADLQFKGDRDYLHGTDLIPAISQKLLENENQHENGYVREIRFKFPIRTLPILVTGTDRRALSGLASAEFVWEKGDRSPPVNGFLYESGDKVTSRYPYSEELATHEFFADDKTGFGPGHKSFSLIENVVAMTKALNKQMFDPTPGQFLFARARLSPDSPRVWNEIRVDYRPIGSQGVSENLVIVDGVLFGSLMFMVGAA